MAAHTVSYHIGALQVDLVTDRAELNTLDVPEGEGAVIVITQATGATVLPVSLLKQIIAQADRALG